MGLALEHQELRGPQWIHCSSTQDMAGAGGGDQLPLKQLRLAHPETELDWCSHPSHQQRAQGAFAHTTLLMLVGPEGRESPLWEEEILWRVSD